MFLCFGPRCVPLSRPPSSVLRVGKALNLLATRKTVAPLPRFLHSTTQPRSTIWRHELLRIGVPPHPKHAKSYDDDYRVLGAEAVVFPQKERLDPPFPFEQEFYTPRFVQILPFEAKQTRSMHINKPETYNSYDFWMLQYIEEQIRKWDRNGVSYSQSIRGDDLCGGPDLHALYDAHLKGDKQFILDYYRNMHQLAFTVGTCRKPTLPIARGFCLGSLGANLLAQATMPVTTEEAVFSITETSYGWFPDGGVSYVLENKLADGMGMYLGLTGSTLKGADLYFAGLADYIMNWADIEGFDHGLGLRPNFEPEGWALLMPTITEDPVHYKNTIQDQLKDIKYCFGEERKTFEEMMNALEDSVDSVKIAIPALKKFKSMNPLMLKLAFKLIREAKGKSLEDVVKRDWIVTQNLLNTSHWVQAMKSVVLKEKPTYQHTSTDDVTDAEIDSLFELRPGVEDYEFIAASTNPGHEIFRRHFEFLGELHQLMKSTVDIVQRKGETEAAMSERSEMDARARYRDPPHFKDTAYSFGTEEEELKEEKEEYDVDEEVEENETSASLKAEDWKSNVYSQ